MNFTVDDAIKETKRKYVPCARFNRSFMNFMSSA